jgi:hypothetical protein
MIVVTAQIMLKCENPDVPSQDLVDNFIAAMNNKVPLWRALPHDPRSTIWATSASLVKIHWGAKKTPLRVVK